MTNDPFLILPHGGPIAIPLSSQADAIAGAVQNCVMTPLSDAQALAVFATKFGINVYEGANLKVSPKILTMSANVSGGVAAFNMTLDGTSGGTAIFNNVYQESIGLSINDALAAYQMSWSLSANNKVLTVTVNKLTTANILTGILGQSAAPNGTVVRLTILGD